MTGNIVSFDIGSAQIKLVWCAGGVCKAAVSAPVPDGLVRGGTIVSMDAMADLLRQLVKENNLPRSAQAAVILPAPLVFTRITELPPMTEGQLTYNLPFEFKDYLTQEKSRYYFDYAVQELVRGEDDSVTRMKLFACATLKTTIEDYRSMMNRAGGLRRAAHRLHPPHPAGEPGLLSGGRGSRRYPYVHPAGRPVHHPPHHRSGHAGSHPLHLRAAGRG